MTTKSILIIGAGIGGLSAGCYLQMNGYDVTILEMHAVPGGVCTAWQREGYTFDGCIHNLAGSCEKSAFHQMWRDLGVLPGVVMHPYDELVQVERPAGDPLIVHTNLDRLADHMKRLAPADVAVIDELIAAARPFSERGAPLYLRSDNARVRQPCTAEMDRRPGHRNGVDRSGKTLEEWRNGELQRQVSRRVPVIGMVPLARRGDSGDRDVAAALQRGLAAFEPRLSDAA